MRFERLKRFLVKFLDLWEAIIDNLEPFCCGSCLALIMTLIIMIGLMITFGVLSLERAFASFGEWCGILAIICFTFDAFMRYLVMIRHRLECLDYHRRNRG